MDVTKIHIDEISQQHRNSNFLNQFTKITQIQIFAFLQGTVCHVKRILKKIERQGAQDALGCCDWLEQMNGDAEPGSYWWESQRRPHLIG
jgi:hypothetical protein